MNPKEGAERIVEMFMPHVYCYLGSGMLTNTLNEAVQTKEAVACAILHVKGMIDILSKLRDNASSKFLIKSAKDIDYEIIQQQAILEELQKM